jgi:nucleoside-diphosphate-sugar epimerase
LKRFQENQKGKMQEVLVTGANGFMGQALCAGLYAEGWHVRGAVRSPQKAGILPKKISPVIIKAIGPDTDWSEALAGIDTVVHLAARVHVLKDAASDPLAAFREVNLKGTAHLAGMAAQPGVRRFIYMSSVKACGENRGLPYSEGNPPEPQGPYGISKWEAEQALHEIANQTGMEVVVIRPPLVYGPGVKANFLRLLKIVGRSLPLPLAGIENRRSLIYLENLVDAVLKCIFHPQASGETYFVSDGVDLSTPELIRKIAAAMRKPPRLFYFPPFLLKAAGRFSGKSGQIDRLTGSLTVDSDKIRRTLGWKPKYTIDQGLAETAKWYVKIKDA